MRISRWPTFDRVVAPEASRRRHARGRAATRRIRDGARSASAGAPCTGADAAVHQGRSPTGGGPDGGPGGQPVPKGRRRRLEPAGIDVPAVSQSLSGARWREETAVDALLAALDGAPVEAAARSALDARHRRGGRGHDDADRRCAYRRAGANGRARQAGARHPQAPSWTLLRGAQVLVDLGESMEPFAADQAQLVEAVTRVAAEPSRARAVVPRHAGPRRR